ncbi:hypothetical protein DFQ28_007382 [Apophysomyces sp. BC1034]|nr:hypothetical protein DFQ30_007300 [Apophysomyces sp. BC1015]KAG0176335.1 hypothetical protein DFQ29_006280 [Apophysomyces sp. BC1021]KAG0186741.1 hypothetical protein DFQ28_007382 [Apophysomyces sp. BC1034]
MSNDNLWIAAGDGQLDRVKELVTSGVDVNSRDEFGYTAMHAAVSYSHADMINLLLSLGANVDIEDADKDTPLFVAETVEIAQLLLNNGANAHHQNEEGVTAALTAHQEGWEDVAEFLAKITGETLPSVDNEDATLAHTIGNTDTDVDGQDFAHQINQVMERIQAENGVQDEEELRETVTKMILEEMKKNM